MAKDIEESRLQSAANTMISISRVGNQYLNEREPWNLLKADKTQAATIFYVAAQIVKALSVVSSPFIPTATDSLWQTLNLPGKASETTWQEALTPLPPGHTINKPTPLFRKIEADEKELDEQLSLVRQKMAKTN